MAQIGDGVTYVGDGSNGTTAGVSYTGTLVRLDAPGGWGLNDIMINLAGTPTLVLDAERDDLLRCARGDGAQPNGTWRAT